MMGFLMDKSADVASLLLLVGFFLTFCAALRATVRPTQGRPSAPRMFHNKAVL